MLSLLAQNGLIFPGVTQPIQGPPLKPEFNNLASVVNKAVNEIVFPVSGLILLLMLIWGGFDYLTSMGDPKKAEGAKHKITNALIGFIFIFAAFWIVQIVDKVFNLKYQ